MTADNSHIDINDDLALMNRAFDLAAQGNLTTHPNPRVGCVIVNDGEIVGEGYHLKAGDLHAERLALQQAGDRARGGTAYVNLEPCCHQGRTPPCTDGLIDAGISRVVAAMHDPNPLVYGGGFEQLKNAGIDVQTGVLEEQATWLNRGFINRMKNNKPWVILKSAATLDGRTADFDGESKWITGDIARDQVQRLRARSSAVITGIGTVLADNPSLNVRLEGAVRQPLRVVLDSQLRLPLDAKIIGDDENLVVFTVSNDIEKISALTELGVEVIRQENQEINLSEVLTELVKWSCNEILVEAGQTLSGAFLESGLVDELVLFYAGTLLGDKGKSMFQFGSPLSFANRVDYSVRNVEMVGNDFKVSAVNQQSLENLSG